MKISQREARRLQRQVRQLLSEQEMQRRTWARAYPGGTHLGTLTVERGYLVGRIEAARMLGYAVVVTENDDGRLALYALPHGKP